MSQPPMTHPEGGPRELPSARLLAAAVVAFAVVMLAMACLGWAGVAVIVAVLVVAHGVLLRWARWPRRTQ
jgi:hypothetical protein